MALACRVGSRLSYLLRPAGSHPHIALSPSSPRYTVCPTLHRCEPSGCGPGCAGTEETLIPAAHVCRHRHVKVHPHSPGLERSILPGLSLGTASGLSCQQRGFHFSWQMKQKMGSCLCLSGMLPAIRGTARLLPAAPAGSGERAEGRLSAEFMFERCRPP